tara:strand:+ start:354 stop:581 length:228 start_codon:yes stop_codon:yes gene_type:complete
MGNKISKNEIEDKLLPIRYDKIYIGYNNLKKLPIGDKPLYLDKKHCEDEDKIIKTKYNSDEKLNTLANAYLYGII